MFYKGKIFAAVTAALFVAAVPAQAMEVAAEKYSEAVRYADLNLNQASGRAELDRRVRSAANSVCAVRQSRTLEDRVLALACRDKALGDVRPQVAALFGKSGGLYAGLKAE